jgi:aminopeptidase N
VAGGRELSRTPAEPGTVRVEWADERPLATYVFGFAAGVFTEATQRAGDVTLRYVGVDVPVAGLTRRFEPTADMLRFFTERAGVGLPGPDYTQVLVAGSVAQEASSFSLIGTEELDPILTDPTEDWVIAHELAHQWWGNSITCKDWSHVWLNEGITTFMVAAYKQQRWGADAYERELGLFRRRHAAAKEANLDVKLGYAGPYPSLRVQRAIVYSKAALFLDRLRRELGDAAFWGGLRRYTREQLGRSVESRDFQRALEAESGRDLSEMRLGVRLSARAGRALSASRAGGRSSPSSARRTRAARARRGGSRPGSGR